MYNITEIKSNNWVYVDTETNVMYWYSGHGYGGGLDVMIDEIGNPKIANKKSTQRILKVLCVLFQFKYK